MINDRQQHIREFLNSCELNNPTVEPLVQDASFRRYFRIYTSTQTFILMDAPPEHEDIRPFILIAKHLAALNLKAPAIIEFDTDNGFILLEDFGDNTFSLLLNHGHDEYELYQSAIDCLINLQQHSNAKVVAVPEYSSELLINEALLLCDWYFPKQIAKQLSNQSRSDYIGLWQRIFDTLPSIDNTLVLRDFHVDNLIRLADGSCGLLDFQDAVIGAPAYDLVSLLEDARRDIPAQLQKQMLDRYFSSIDSDRENFMRWYRVLGAQRHCKVLGIFTRLSVRDNKHHYLEHLPRVKKLLQAHLKQPDLQPLRNWLEKAGLVTNEK